MKISVAILLGIFLVSSLQAAERVNDRNWQQNPMIKKIRALYTKINHGQKTGRLKKETQKCELYGGDVEIEGELYTDHNSVVRKYVVDATSGDSSARAEYYYNKKGVPRFTYRFRGAYNGTEVEERIYFDKEGKHFYTNRKEKGPGYNPSNLTDAVQNPRADYSSLCKEQVPN